MNPPVTQKQIAERLGISPGMVGRALRDDASYSEATRERIQRTAREMGYHGGSNQAARDLASRRYGKTARQGVIGCSQICGDREVVPYSNHLIDGIKRAARLSETEVMLFDEAWRHREKIDGLLIHGVLRKDWERTLAMGIPVVSMMVDTPGIPAVVIDDYAGTRAACEHLLSLGHRRIGYLIQTTYPLNDNPLTALQRRMDGYRDALIEAGIEPRNEWIHDLMNVGNFLTRGYKSMQHWLATGWHDLGCTALMVQNDRAAIAVMRALAQAGIRVPEDVSVVGFDSTDECELCTPHLTSVRTPLEDIGYTAMQILHKAIDEGTAPPPITVLPTALDVRDSTAPPAL